MNKTVIIKSRPSRYFYIYNIMEICQSNQGATDTLITPTLYLKKVTIE